MAHPQSSPRGLWAKKRIDVGASQITANSTGLVLNAGIKVSNKANAVLTGNSTGIVTNAQIRVANKRYLNANSTGFIVTAESAIPTTDNGAAFTFISNSTGFFGALNTTGTTWKYFEVTSRMRT